MADAVKVVYEKPIYQSKKFLTAVFTAVFIIANKYLEIGLDAATLDNLVNIAIVYIVGQGLADTGKNKPIIAEKTAK